MVHGHFILIFSFQVFEIANGNTVKLDPTQPMTSKYLYRNNKSKSAFHIRSINAFNKESSVCYREKNKVFTYASKAKETIANEKD